METFKNIRLYRWRQFEDISIDFNTQLTVLTGRNGCGKTSILNVLGRHFGWNINFVSTPFLSKRKSKKFWSDYSESFSLDSEIPPNATKVGTIAYSNDQICDLFNPNQQNAQYNLQYNNQQEVYGLNIPSHRPVATYHEIKQIPTNPKTNQKQFEEFQQLLLQTYGSGNTKNPGVILKQSLIALAVFGFGNEAVTANLEYRDLFERFQNILKILLPKEIGFERLEIRMPDIVLVSKTGDFNLDAMSGGINALFSIAWQVHMYGADKSNCTILIDEPENHLHPSMQREFLPALKEAFPHFKFIIATHSPFIISSLPDAKVFALIHNDKGKIKSEELMEKDLMGSANKILRDILDVPVTIPKWVEDRVKTILQEYPSDQFNEEKAKELYRKLQNEGFDKILKDINPDSV